MRLYNSPAARFSRRRDPANPVGQEISYDAATTPIKRPKFRYPRAGWGQDAVKDKGLIDWNTKLLADTIAKLSDQGGAIAFDRELFYSGPLEFPRRVFHPQPWKCPLNFAIEGIGPRAQLVNVNPSAPAVVIEGGNAHHLAGDLARQSLRNVDILSAGDGLHLTNCGESLELEGVRLIECRGVPLVARRLYGFSLGNRLTIRNCGGPARFFGCKLGHWGMIAVRNCLAGVEFLPDEQGLPSGHHYYNRIDAEGNDTFNFRAGLRDSELALWLEAAGNGLQGDLFDCSHNLRLVGELADERGQAFATDAISTLETTLNDRPLPHRSKPLPRVTPNAATSASCRIPPRYPPESDMAGGRPIKVELPPGCTAAVAESGVISWCNLGIGSRAWAPGEWLDCLIRVTLDEAAAAYFAARPDLPCGHLVWSDPDAPRSWDGNAVQGLYLRDSDSRNFVLRTKCVGFSRPRLFWYPPRAEASQTNTDTLAIVIHLLTADLVA